MTISYKSLLVASAVAALVQNVALADDEYNVSTGITPAGVPLGLHGFDSVVLSTTGAVARGSAVYGIEHDGAVYYFASQLSAKIFATDPESYLPQYGGFCAYAVAFGRKFDGDPRFADIVDGKLYLFVNGEIFEKYLANKEQILADAKKNWPSIQHKAVDKL
jgi:YHS domain-containing protein